MTALTLSNVDPDFEEILTQLQAYLSAKESWTGFLPTQTGQTILEMIAAVGAYSQTSLQRYYEDAFPYTAQNDQAIYAITSMLGLRLTRKAPASCTVSLSAPAPAVVPVYTPFVIGGVKLFNRAPLSVGVSPATFTLYEGEIVRAINTGRNEDYSLFVSAEKDFRVSNTDISVYINAVSVPVTYNGLWKFKGTSGVNDRTLPDGRLVIEFGNSTYGSRPSNSDTVEIVYVITKGTGGNSLKTANKKITCDNYPTVTGSGTTDLGGGSDEQPALVYKNIGGTTFGTFGAAVTKTQYLSTALTYPGVVDALSFAQREVNPNALAWMNLVKMVLLTSTAWNPSQKAAFIASMEARTMYSTKFFLEDPVPVPVTVTGTLYLYPWATPSTCITDAQNAITTLFAAKPGSLGYDFFISDIHDAILESNKGIEYITLTSPTYDVVVSVRPSVAPTATAVGGGTLAAGTYMYAISVVTPEGEIAPKNWVSVTVPGPTSGVLLSWPPYGSATSYKVWGRSQSGLGLIASGVTATNFTDTGAIVVTGTLPPQSTIPVKYATLSAATFTTVYSTRSGSRNFQ